METSPGASSSEQKDGARRRASKVLARFLLKEAQHFSTQSDLQHDSNQCMVQTKAIGLKTGHCGYVLLKFQYLPPLSTKRSLKIGLINWLYRLVNLIHVQFSSVWFEKLAKKISWRSGTGLGGVIGKEFRFKPF